MDQGPVVTGQLEEVLGRPAEFDDLGGGGGRVLVGRPAPAVHRQHQPALARQRAQRHAVQTTDPIDYSIVRKELKATTLERHHPPTSADCQRCRMATLVGQAHLSKQTSRSRATRLAQARAARPRPAATAERLLAIDTTPWRSSARISYSSNVQPCSSRCSAPRRTVTQSSRLVDRHQPCRVCIGST